MIAICCATSDEPAFRAAGALTVEALDDGNSLLLRRHDRESVVAPCNEMLAALRRRDDLEAVVLVHEDAVVQREVDVLATVRRLLAADGDVAVVGSVEDGRPREVAAADPALLALSPWTARNLSFDLTLDGSADAAAYDLSLRAREAGRRVLGVPLGVARMPPLRSGPVGRRAQLHAMLKLRHKWGDRALGEIG